MVERLVSGSRVAMPGRTVPRRGVQLLTGVEAVACLAADGFRAQWSDLADRCPWATAFQSPGFAATWYQAYADRYDPVLVLFRSENGRLDGLLALARVARGTGLVAAGAHQAEYQVWLSSVEQGDVFPLGAFELLRRRFPSSRLKLSYLPPAAPLGWREVGSPRRLTVVKACRRPLLNLESVGAAESALRKPGNKSRLRQLKKLGPVEFARVTDASEYTRVLERFVQYHDCRQCASHGSTPFQTDPRKKAFHQALLNVPGLLHVTVLKVGDEIASAQVNVIHRSDVQLCLIAHNPEFERLSPGKLHIRFLAKMLAEEGYERLDLTPGGEAYKDRFANGADTVHSLTVFPTAMRRWVSGGLAALENGARPILSHLNVRRSRMLALAEKARHFDLAGVGSELRSIARTWFSSPQG